MATIEKAAPFAAPGQPGSPVELKTRYENFIGGFWVAPIGGKYTENVSPATGEAFTEVPLSTPEDIELALDAAHAAKDAWGETSTAERSKVLNRIADVIEENLELLAVAESWENGKPIRETLAATSCSRPITSATSPRSSGPKRAGSPSSTRARSRTTSASRSGSPARSSRSTSRC